MDVYWLQQSEADLPATDDWLCESETARLSMFRFAKRRTDWRLGRWTAKCAVAASFKLPGDRLSLKEIEIYPASTGQPEVALHDRTERVTISISHRGGVGFCAVALGDVKLGCDLEMIEPRSDAFISDYFTKSEQQLIAQASCADRPLLASLVWSAKESALKALHVGLRADTRSVEVNELGLQCDWYGKTGALSTCDDLRSEMPDTSETNWRALHLRCAGETYYCGWWQQSHNVVRTIVGAPPPAPPRRLGAANKVTQELCRNL